MTSKLVKVVEDCDSRWEQYLEVNEIDKSKLDPLAFTLYRIGYMQGRMDEESQNKNEKVEESARREIVDRPICGLYLPEKKDDIGSTPSN